MEALPWAWVVASNPRRIGLNFASKKKLQNRPRFSRDQPRSTTIERRSCSRFFETAAQRSWNKFHAGGSTIAARSDCKRGVLPRVAYSVGLESDAPDSREERETPLFTVAVGSRSIGKSSPAIHLDENRMMIVANDLECLSRDAFSAV